MRVQCPKCGKRFKAPDAAVGRNGRCMQCGEIFVLEEAAPDGTGNPDAVPPSLPSAAPADSRSGPASVANAASPAQPRPGFLSDAWASFAVPLRGSGPFMLGLLTFLQVINMVLKFAFIFGLLGQIFISGWLWAYYFRVILHTAAGDDDLPDFGMDGGVMEDIIRPLLRMIGSFLWVFWPAIAWIIASGRMDLIENPASDTLVAAALLLLGLFFWPMTALSIAIHGFDWSALNYGRMVVSIARAFPGYLMIWLLLLACGYVWAYGLGRVGALAIMVGLGNTILGIAVVAIGLALIQSYITLVAMRAIGTYYKHFKHRFAWVAE